MSAPGAMPGVFLKEAIADDKETKAEEARDKADQADQDAADKQKAADEAKQEAEEAAERAQNSDPAIETAGDLTIHAGDDIGQKENPLDVDVNGTINTGTPGDVYISSKDDVHIGDLDVDDNADKDRDVTISAGGDITSDTTITGGNVEINTLDGNVGTDDKPLDLDADNLSGTISGNGNETGTGTDAGSGAGRTDCHYVCAAGRNSVGRPGIL